jgi:hypothetical protein
MIMRSLLLLLTLPARAATTPAELPRAQICLNGSWDTLLNTPAGKIPDSGWTSAYNGGGTGLIVQHPPLIQGKPPAATKWLSESGEGNRPPTLPSVQGTPTAYSTHFARLYAKFTKQPARATGTNAFPELLVSGLGAGDVPLLVPADSTVSETRGVAAAKDGTAWFFASEPGDYILLAGPKPKTVHLNSSRVTEI